MTKKVKSALIVTIFLLTIVIAGGVYYYLAIPRFPLAPKSSPAPLKTEVSTSTGASAIEKELNDTDFGSFEKDLEQLDIDASQL